MAKETNKNETKETTGVCRFCGQSRIVRGDADMTEEQLTEEATFACSCEAAEQYRNRVWRTSAAKENIDTLFGDEADRFAQPKAVTDFMKRGADLIDNEDVKSLTINLKKGLKCKITLMTDNKIKVSREAKSVVEFKE